MSMKQEENDLYIIPPNFIESLLIKSQVFFEENFKKSDLIF